MKKDIQIPVVKDVYVAVVNEFNKEHRTFNWNAYIINNTDEVLETVLIVSSGYNQNKQTPVMRHRLEFLPARSFAKIEYMQEAVLDLNNEFKVTFFKAGQMFDKSYVFRKNSINERAFQQVPLMHTKGVLAK